MGLSKKIRFEVFKRDEFTCQYCGRKPPSVILEADHILAKSRGGDDTLINLITACFDCNRGKSDGDLTKIPECRTKTLELEQERETQANEYNKFLLRRRKRETKALNNIGYYWFNHFKEEQNMFIFGKARIPSIRKFLSLLPETEILDAIEITFSRIPVYDDNDYKAWKYFCGICWNKIKSTTEGE